MFETWVLQPDSSLKGHSFIMSHTDTVFIEEMKIIESDTGIFYLASVRHNQGAVAFKFVECTPRGCVFENATHDFPNRIIYANTIGDMLLARIEGMRDNKPDTSRFFMHRKKMFDEGW